ncbi:MAG: TRAP transporter permease [Oscillospiraceae bacterium]|nr:TRAP transporter permease [Oscillospiraceae bacterium]
MTDHEEQDFKQEDNLIDQPIADEQLVSEEEIQRKMAKVSKESNTRQFSGVPKLIMRWLCVAFTLYVLIINIGFIRLPPQIHRASFVALLLLYTFLLYPARKKDGGRLNHMPWYDLVLGIVGAACFFYYVVNFQTIVGQMSTFTTMDVIVAIVGIAILFIACHRVVGLPLIIVVGAFLAYAYFGRYIPGVLGHAGYRVERIFTYLFYTTEGVIGTPIGVISTFIFLFLLFSAFLMRTGISTLFIDLANVIAGRAVGGPAKVSVVVSALEGMVSGSSIANTVASGSFTIPLMKRLGYEKNFAGGVEAAASTGGQILPPILGAAAFLMAEITGIPFGQIALAALIPAFLYFSCVFASVHFEAKKTNLRPIPSDEIPKFRSLVGRLHLLLPLVSLVLLLATGTTIARAALYSTAVAIVVSMIRKDTRLTPKKFFDALEAAAKNSIGVGVACAMAGMIVGVVTLTGLGMAFATSMISLADGIANDTLRMVIILFFCLLASIILGLGVPTTAKYLIMATITAPIIVSLGVPILAAHMFVFFAATDADITPPVGLAAYAAAAISGGSPMRTSVIATRLAISDFIIPFAFVFNPQMLFIEPTLMGVIQVTVTSLIGILGVASGLSGYLVRRLHGFERILLIGGGICLISTDITTDIIGAVIVVGMYLLQRVQNRKGSGPVPA